MLQMYRPILYGKFKLCMVDYGSGHCIGTYMGRWDRSMGSIDGIDRWDRSMGSIDDIDRWTGSMFQSMAQSMFQSIIMNGLAA